MHVVSIPVGAVMRETFFSTNCVNWPWSRALWL